MQWNQLANDESINKAIAALGANGVDATVVVNGAEATQKALELIPQGAEVMTMSSLTVNDIGLAKELNESGRFSPVREKLKVMDQEKQALDRQRLGAAPEWAVGSVQAVTEDGHLLIASNTGSQLPSYAYGSMHVIWVVGAQKIVKDTQEGIRRIYEYCVPLESERAKKAYGASGSATNKLLIINKEIQNNRLHLIFIKEVIGF